MQRIWPWVWGALVVGAWLASPFVVKGMAGESGQAGTFGDSFGALTSLFTGLAFVGLIVTLRQQKAQIAMQREDLKLQRDEMVAARAELSGQKEQMELQNQSLKQQMFEQTFFNLLNVFNQYIVDLVENGPLLSGEPKRGRDQLGRILVDLIDVAYRFDEIKEGKRVEVVRTSTEMMELTVRSFLSNYFHHADDLNSYFRLLYNILKLVDQSGVDQKKTYTNILRAQLTDSELLLIALNCACADAVKLQTLVERYDVLKHLPPTLNGLDIQSVCEEIWRQEIEEDARE